MLVNPATGAIGSAAVQLLKDLGAQVVAVCGAEHVELVRGLGADRVIDRDATDFTRDDETYDLVFDAVGKSSFERCRRLLGPHGIYVSSDLGPLSSNPFLALVTPPFGRRKVIFPIPRGTPARRWSGSRRCWHPAASGRWSTADTRWSRSPMRIDTWRPVRSWATC